MRKFDKILILFAIVMLFGSVTGCGNKAPEVTTTHHEYGSYTLIATEIYEECMANNDAQGAHDAIETMRYLSAFCCNGVHYDDVKNRNYNNINYNVGELQLAVAAYNENNDESALNAILIIDSDTFELEKQITVNEYLVAVDEMRYSSTNEDILIIRQYDNCIRTYDVNTGELLDEKIVFQQ